MGRILVDDQGVGRQTVLIVNPTDCADQAVRYRFIGLSGQQDRVIEETFIITSKSAIHRYRATHAIHTLLQWSKDQPISPIDEVVVKGANKHRLRHIPVVFVKDYLVMNFCPDLTHLGGSSFRGTNVHRHGHGWRGFGPGGRRMQTQDPAETLNFEAQCGVSNDLVGELRHHIRDPGIPVAGGGIGKDVVPLVDPLVDDLIGHTRRVHDCIKKSGCLIQNQFPFLAHLGHPKELHFQNLPRGGGC